eukprot:CAMPEP_0181502012 /NCGR_PEP_ID=MMETSP1110-20121109/56117_1 /TAXON_ID=174948 /ORGANISM="Symbiodinium sp., Strain CCMP421" /LENGTH=1259 /DNA_ID=CAMNT_0023630541 /DNA_START=59 /DNA_END=3838 /DNA_ORIENTATION=-
MATPSSEASKTVRVDWNDLDLVARIKKGKELEDKKILSKVSGFALPGELLAIMGPSGAGKTSLLNCLAVRTAPSSGALSFNSMELSKAVKRKVAYVHQQEMLLECYTPREHLLFQSKLRMPSSVGAEARKLRVEASIKMLGLEKCQHSLIGDVYSGISKNEKRRVSFATEILTQPSVLYCDEPTTGLDSVMAEVIVKYMKAIALAGNNGQKVTVIASVHQPSSQVFRLFDRLHFLIDGRTAYFGQLSKLEEHFAKIGFQMPDHTMPADFVMKLCINPRDPEGAAKRRVEISDAWDKQWPNEDARIHGAPIQVIPKAVSEMPVEEKHTNWFVSLLYLTKREVIMKVRAKAELRSALLRTVVLGLLFGLTFLQVEKTQTTLFTLNGCLFFAMMFGVMNICMAASMGIPTRLPTLIREHRNGAYSVPAIYVSKVLADLPFDLLVAGIWGLLLYWMVDFRGDWEHFLYFFLVLYLMTNIATGVGYLGGYLAPVPALSMLVVLLNIMPQMLFGGLFMNLSAVPPGLVWLSTISMFRLGFEALMVNQWQDYGDLPCPPGAPCVASSGLQVLENNGISQDASYSGIILWLLLPLGIYHLLAFLALWRRARPRQFESAAPEDDTKGELRRDGEEQTQLTSIQRPEILVQWEDLTVEVMRTDMTGARKQTQILENAQGCVEPGQLLAVMGPSGSGKSTLLKSLAGIGEVPLQGGSRISINGTAWTPEIREHSAFLFQDEQLFAGLTVREHLLFQSGFRMGRMSKAERGKRADALLLELGLSKCQNTLIGSIGSGISGGERRRLAFATELLTEPTLLFADEATSGLDSAMAYNVTKLLHDFARGENTTKKTVLATIHQPSEEVFNLFDKVLIIVEGRSVYFGPPSAALQHFSSLGMECPRDESPPDFFMRCVAIDAGEDEARAEAAEEHGEAPDDAFAPGAPEDAGREDDRGPIAAREPLRSDDGLGAPRDAAAPEEQAALQGGGGAHSAHVFAAGAPLLAAPNDQQSWQSVMGLLNMVMINTFMTAGFGLTQELPHAFRPAFREVRAGMYSITAWFWSKSIGDLPVDLIGAAVGASLVCLMTGIAQSTQAFLLFMLLVMIMAQIGNTWGYLCSALGGRAEYAFAVFLLTVFPFMIFNGFLITTENIPIYFRWIEYVSAFKPAFTEFAVAIWKSRSTIDCPGGGNCPLQSGDDVLALFGLSNPDHVFNWVMLVPVYIVGVRLLAWGALVLRLTLGSSNVAKAGAKPKTKSAQVQIINTEEVSKNEDQPV